MGQQQKAKFKLTVEEKEQLADLIFGSIPLGQPLPLKLQRIYQLILQNEGAFCVLLSTVGSIQEAVRQFEKMDKNKLEVPVWNYYGGGEYNDEMFGKEDAPMEDETSSMPSEKQSSDSAMIEQMLQIKEEIKEKLRELPKNPKKFKRFLSVYYLAENKLEQQLNVRPSMFSKKNIAEKLPFSFGENLSVSQKKERLQQHYLGFDFWQGCFKPLFEKELASNGYEMKNKKFQECLSAFTRKHERSQWKKEVEEFLDRIPSLTLDWLRQQLCFEMVDYVTFHTTLPNPKKAAKTEHDKHIGSMKVTCCQQYAEILTLYVSDKAKGRTKFITHSTWPEYAQHRLKCKQCQHYENLLGHDIMYRLKRIKEMKQAVYSHFYPGHRTEERKKQLDPERLFQYYKKLHRDKPSDLYEAYLTILQKRSGRKEEFVPTADSQKKKKNRGSQFGCALEVYCICGAVKSYTLNALRFPVVNLGRKLNDIAHYHFPHISLCKDDKPYLAQDILQFNFNGEDWEVGVPPLQKPHFQNLSEEKACNDRQRRLASLIFYLSKEEVFRWLQTQSKKAVTEQGDIPEELWHPFSVEPKLLSSIVGIGIRLKKRFQWNGKPFPGVCHPVLGRLNQVGWFIEINQNRSMLTIVPSVIATSVL